ncbi:hypothetical protein QQP08_013071 [Theobroma cacao]|nr:hypothetical protein QQP08_013071 [Theobroma cacao]
MVGRRQCLCFYSIPATPHGLVSNNTDNAHLRFHLMLWKKLSHVSCFLLELSIKLSDTIILADRSEQKAFKYTGITCFNPVSFSDDSTFVAYRPCTQEVEFSAL